MFVVSQHRIQRRGARARSAGSLPACTAGILPASQRRGAAAVMVAVSLVALLSVASLTVDVGSMYRARNELQRSADSAAMAGAWRLLDAQQLQGTPNMTQEIAAARAAAVQYAALNHVMGAAPVVDPQADVTVGYIYDPMNPAEPISFGNPNQFNAVRVLVHRDNIRNGPLNLMFARIFGQQTANVHAEATAVFKNGVVGYHVTPQTGNAYLLPFAVKVSFWNDLLAGTFTTGDHYRYDTQNGQVTIGLDSINEMNIYPGNGGNGQLPPGNFGTVNIGPSSNSTDHLISQILNGVTAEDFSYYPNGELVLGPNGNVPLTGDTGLSAAVKDALTAIVGQPRAIPLFSTVSGPGNNATFTIVGFAGIRIMHVELTGNPKEVIVQPSFVVDNSAISEPGSGSSSFIYEPVRLIR
ncbi:MAG TPA: TadG family pilus assembly protein [Phycisphaerae bacterium]|jgi:Flp pilus assembly protein TadG